jgi:predicted nucleic acid-binding protein
VTDAVLIWQVACEYVAASRKLQAAGYGADRAWSDIMRLSRLWPLRMPSNQVLARAWSVNQTKSLSVWDALLVAACLDAEVTTLYTEDLQHGADIESLRIVNPFVQST